MLAAFAAPIQIKTKHHFKAKHTVSFLRNAGTLDGARPVAIIVTHSPDEIVEHFAASVRPLKRKT